MKLTANDIHNALGSVEAVLARGGYNDKVTPHLLLARRTLKPIVQTIEDERLAILKEFAKSTEEGNLLSDANGGPIWKDEAAGANGNAALRKLGLREFKVGRLVKMAYGDLPRDKEGEHRIEGLHQSNLEFMISGVPAPDGEEVPDGE